MFSIYLERFYCQTFVRSGSCCKNCETLNCCFEGEACHMSPRNIEHWSSVQFWNVLLTYNRFVRPGSETQKRCCVDIHALLDSYIGERVLVPWNCVLDVLHSQKRPDNCTRAFNNVVWRKYSDVVCVLWKVFTNVLPIYHQLWLKCVLISVR